MIKKLSTIFIVMLITLTTLCAQAASEEEGPIRIGISKLMAHPALDLIEQGIQDHLNQAGIDAVFNTQNANGDIATASSIAQLFKSEGCDIVVGIATPTAQALANVFTDIPVVYATVTDVEAAGLAGLANVCGTSDAVPLQEHFNLIEDVVGASSIGMVYTAGEANGLSMMEGMRAVCEAAGVDFVSASVSNSSEVRTAALSIVDRVDAMYVSTDNTVISAVNTLAEVCLEHGVPLFSADTTSSFGSSVLIAGGFDYYKSGLQTGEIVERILNGEEPSGIGAVYLADLEYYVDLDVADALGITISEEILENAAYIMRNGEDTIG